MNNSTNISLSGATIYMQQITGLELDMKINHWACFCLYYHTKIFHNNTFLNHGTNISSPDANIFMQEITGLEHINQHALS